MQTSCGLKAIPLIVCLFLNDYVLKTGAGRGLFIPLDRLNFPTHLVDLCALTICRIISLQSMQAFICLWLEDDEDCVTGDDDAAIAYKSAAEAGF